MGIDLTDAQAAKVKQAPKVPGVVPANNNDLTVPKLQPLGPGGPGSEPIMAPQTDNAPQNPASTLPQPQQPQSPPNQ